MSTMPLRFRQQEAANIIRANPGHFRPGFAAWLGDNLGIVDRVFVTATAGWEAGIKRTGINKIIEYLRWDTMLREKGGGGFKISDSWTSSMARLWAFMYPEMKTLFAYHERANGVVLSPDNSPQPYQGVLR